MFLVFSKSVIHYLWQGEISICKMLVPIKIVLGKNYYIFHQKFEMKHLLKYLFLISETKIYTTTWRSRCCQLHRVESLNISARRYISCRQIWNICLTVVTFWVYLRFRIVEIEYLRKMGICIPKYTA